MQAADMPQIAEFVARVLVHNENPENIAKEVSEFRKKFNSIHYIRK